MPQAADNANSVMMCVAWDEEGEGAQQGDQQGETSGDDGIVRGHAYALLRVLTVGEVRLVQLRNPHGKSKEWNGDWCERHV